MEDGFNITREDVIINYIPSSNVSEYSYVINKDNVNGNTKTIKSNNKTRIVLTENGTYKVTITNTLNDESKSFKTYKYVIDKEAPKLNIKEKTYVITTKDKFVLNATAFDNYDGDLTSKIVTNIDDLDFKTTGVKKVSLSVTDSAGNVAQDMVFVTVKKDYTNILYLGWFILIVALVLLFNFLYKYIKSIKYEKRFSKYAIDNRIRANSLFDSIYDKYIDFINKYSIYLEDFTLFKKAAKYYEKYNEDGIKLIMRKIILGLLFIILFIIINLLRSKIIGIRGMIISFILGYLVLSVIYSFKYLKYRKQVKGDLLKAVTLLNNAFKSGKSIEQAIEVVSTELEGPIALEFGRIKQELSYGLDLDIAFKRFRDRINSEEAVYLSASISVVNKTGGNIIKVFNSIEKTLYSKKKLNEELNALTSSSKFVMYTLIFVPPLFIVFISFINKGYFIPLLTHPLGIVLMLIELVIYVVYIIVVIKVMKIR